MKNNSTQINKEHHGNNKANEKEEEWIKDLKKLMRKKPKNLILFADGNLNILKGSKENPSCETEDGGMDKNRVVDSILFVCDGGAF